MLFSSTVFLWIFLPIVFVGNFLCQRLGGNRLANALLLVASIFFYAWGEPVYVLLMLVSILVNWGAGMLLAQREKGKRAVLAADVLVNLALLGYFKYAGMLVETWNSLTGAAAAVPRIPLPIGISFFTFQALSYVIDVYRGECPVQRSVFRLALYVSFFPQLIAGPIVKYRDVSEQIEHRTLSLEKTASGIRRFVYGLGKKVLLANVMALCADRLYAVELEQVSSAMAWLAAVAYTLQIYYDFSGYSDMAIGLGRMFGFEFQENFNLPYQSRSIREFWRRWHISLSSWFRDYVYIPLGGNRKGEARTYLNLLIVFFCTGFWHGASWSFVLWGLYHGFFSIVERLGLGKVLKKTRVLSSVYTLLVVVFGWVLFRVEDLERALGYFRRMLQPWKYAAAPLPLSAWADGYTAAMLVLGVLGAGILQAVLRRTGLDRKGRYSAAEIAFCAAVLVLCIMSLASNTYNPFIYFRF